MNDLNARARKIVDAFALPGDISAMYAFVAAELRSAVEEDRGHVIHDLTEETYKRGKSEAYADAARIAENIEAKDGGKIGAVIAEMIRTRAEEVK